MSDKVSDLFMDCVTDNHGSPSIDCEFCGRTHFTHEAEDVEKLRRKEKAEPDLYREDAANDSIAWGYLEGRQYVWKCPCSDEKIAKYEQFIWRHRVLIAKYLKRRTAEELAMAQLNAGMVKDIGEQPTSG